MIKIEIEIEIKIEIKIEMRRKEHDYKMEEIIKILSDLHPDTDFQTETKLIESGILDSFDIISIVGELNHVFEIEINAEDLLPENFNSAKAIYALVCRLQDE